MKYDYPCVRFKQTSSDKWLVQFAARATDIDEWAGVPQKSRFEFGGETVGFQRQENLKRVNNLRDFYSNTDNIIQNPLLCSLRDAPLCSVTFQPHAHASTSEAVEFGTLVVEIPDFSVFTMEDCLRHVRDALEHRVPELKDQNLDAAVKQMRRIAMDEGYVSAQDEQNLIESIDSNDDETEELGNGNGAAGVLFEESHLVDFWEVVAARHEVIKEVGADEGRVEFLGFTKDVLVSYLRPIVLVDGQHRLRGAIVAAEERLKEDPIKQEAGDRIANGECADEVQREILSRETRLLPISLLMSTSPEEQVFQFVVVNQKATPIGRALLGTIVSTTLAKGEMDKVADRLKSAGIEVEESQAVTYLARHPSSPFVDRVERGLAGTGGDGTDMLKWNVLASLVSIFRHLKGGKLFGQRNDYADIWAEKYLAASPIVGDYDEKGYESAIKYWSKVDGPWRDVFIAFWTEVRGKFGNDEDTDKHNYWGRPRTSNLFNKVSLTILAADFFQSLVETKRTIQDASEVRDLVNSWLDDDVSLQYFDKDWRLTGVKKDSAGIRKQWASIWSEYRKGGGKLPDRRVYSRPKQD